ncbi:MAG: hypothetical protein QGI83_09570, partial [Candidatus Latescibacteria bacterium]|nr:hypothetical protein [Candidatus Latescibacterota bacterium]
GAQGSRARVLPFDLTTLLYVTSDPEAAERLRKSYAEQLSRLSQMALDVFLDKLAKTQVVLEHLPAESRAKYEKSGELAREASDRMVQAYRSGDFGSTYRMAREHILPLRSIQASIVESAEATMEERDLTIEQRRHTNIFFSIPRYYASLGDVEDVAPGQLKREALERIHVLRAPFVDADDSD